MSFKTITPAPARLNRSELSVPGSSPKFFEKAAKSDADVVFLDLEDAVAPEKKAEARRNIIQAIGDIDWGDKTLSVRINGLDTVYMYRDLVEVLENCSERLDLVMVPKVGTAADVYAVDMLISQIERAKGRKKRLGLELIIETALGMQNIHAIAAASPRNESLHFGVADFAASTQAKITSIGGPNPLYGVLTDPLGPDKKRDYHWGDMWHYAIARLVIAARANGLRPIDGPFGDYSDPEGFRAHAQRATVLGCEGKWAIHPSQIALANEVFTPSDEEVAGARRILEAMEDAAQEGKGAVALDGRLIDAASIRMAQNLVAKADQIALKEKR
jgi:malyl-CoA/(S)-citramalyl-CoA lyase